MTNPNASCTPGIKSNHLVFTQAGSSCGSHRHHADHWTHFRTGGPFWVRVFYHGTDGKRGNIKTANGPFGPGQKFFVDKNLHHEILSDGPGEADCVFENDGTPECGKERP